jgi:hypothetical protein
MKNMDKRKFIDDLYTYNMSKYSLSQLKYMMIYLRGRSKIVGRQTGISGTIEILGLSVRLNSIIEKRENSMRKVRRLS